MDPTCDHRTRSINNELVQSMFVYLADMCRVGNREHEGLSRHMFSWRMFETRASFHHGCFLRDPFEEIPNLPIGWRFYDSAFSFTQFFSQTFDSHILVDSHESGTKWLRIQFPKQW